MSSPVSPSEQLLARALDVLPGGVSSPVRAFKAVGGTPRFIKRASGAHIWDVEDRQYLDFVSSWGPMILGHAHPEVVAAVKAAAENGTSYGATCPGEVELAERVARHVPSIEKVRFVSSGTEATMSALRLARGFTGRSKILKFEGAYHGHADGLLVAAGSGVATLAIPGSPGVPAGTVADTLLAPYNDLDALDAILGRHARELAAIIVEPVAGNMGCVPPAAGFLEGLRERCTSVGALLIFDEVITGFRLGLGGAQMLYAVSPDLTCLGKIIGGGLPVGAYGGSARIMDVVAPSGPVYQAGTLSGNPLAMAAGVATIDVLEREKPYARLESLAGRLAAGLREAAARHRVTLTVNQVGSMLTPFFAAGPVRDFGSAGLADTSRFAVFFHALLRHGIAWPPAQLEAGFVSAAHAAQDIDRTLATADEALMEVARS